MSKLTDRASYLKGLADGMKLDTEKGANRLLLELLNLMADTAAELETLSEAHDELNDYVESIDDDLADLEETLFGDDDDSAPIDLDDEDEDDNEDDPLISYACPHCGHELQFRASDVDFEEDYLCPECGKSVFPELEDDDDEDDAPAEDPDSEE